MRIVNMHEAKTHFSKLIDSVMKGNEKGKIKIAKGFDDPLPEDILTDFESPL